MRCVNIDWLEVYCEESINFFPCNAEFFRGQGYIVQERDYGTRVYNEMFTLMDDDNNPMIEIRRNPKSGDSSFVGLSEMSTHVRLANWMCYRDDCVSFLRDFLLRFNYVFHRIYRIDVCYDFVRFDSGDKPERVARRILSKTYLKINQGRIAAYGADNWADYDWETLSWGSPSSMVSTKMYNKTKELKSNPKDKPYIRSQWFMCGLVDNPVTGAKRDSSGEIIYPDVWRVEFSMKSKADRWLVIESQTGKKVKKKAVPHSLALFDSKDKLWQRFQDLAYHYFRFKIRTEKKPTKRVTEFALGMVKAEREETLQRKDRMPNKVLFHFDADREFLHINQIPKPSHQSNDLLILKHRLEAYRNTHFEADIRHACSIIIEQLERKEVSRVATKVSLVEIKALQAAIRLKMDGDERSTIEILATIQEMLTNSEIF